MTRRTARNKAARPVAQTGAQEARRREEPASGPTRRARETARRRAAGGPPLVLVVDDFKDGRDLVVETLEHAGFSTAEAADGPEALSKCRSLRPDLVLMDLSLPGLDGWEVTRRLRADAALRGLKVLALTAHAQVDALERAREAGADGVITKPCLPNQVVARVKEALGARASAAPEGSD